ncbi:MAG TPA: CoA-transferase [Bacillota bacterium]|nr:CoA-transferase [Bacillota bacterium]HQE10888.1 CoA-transferase [Bacillota bacterium]
MMFRLPWVDEALERRAGTGAGGGKVTTLAEAVRELVRPGFSLQIGSGLGYPMALLYEIIRQFWGRDPGFTFITYGGSCTNLVPFLAGGLVKKVLASYLGDSYPFPAPNPLIQKTFAEGKVELEEWSMLTLTQRLAAGAMGFPFFPTRSLAGSSLAENLTDFTLVEDPFSGEEVGLVKALRPDLSLVHGWLADPEGNTVLSLPLVGNAYGALAAREGAIVTVEKVVSAAELSRCREHVRIPAEAVRAVVEVPFGAHPSGHHHFPHRGDTWGYAEDRPFIMEARRASRSAESYRAWLDEWILGCLDHRSYLAKLGRERLFALKGKLSLDAWPLHFLEEERGETPTPTAAEQMIVLAGREIERVAVERGYSTILAGVGASHMASWLAYYSLLEQGRQMPLLAEIGLYGFIPLPGDSFVFALRNFPTAGLYADVLHILGCFVSGKAGRCLGVLGAAQVDCRGNINSSQVPAASLYLVGSGGGNDVASGAAEVIVVAEQAPHRFVEKVPFITSPGDKVSAVISQYGLFRKDPADGILKLAAYLERPGLDEAEIIREIKEQCRWELQLWPHLQAAAPPTPEELSRLRCLDPERYFTR